MANHINMFIERTDMLGNPAQTISERTTCNATDIKVSDIWRSYVVSFYQDEHVPFEKVRIERRCSMIVLQLFVICLGEGGDKTHKSDREKLFILMTFMSTETVD